jgi:hypothetical protein
MHVSHVVTSRKNGRALIRGSYRSQHGGGGVATFFSLVTNDVTKFKIFLTYQTY